MITIRFRKRNDEYLSFEVEGHAHFADPGQDIVCAGISAIAFMGINAMTQVANVPEPIQEVGDDGYAYCEIPNELTREQWDKSQTIFETVFVGFLGIELSYNDYIKILIEEVHPDAKS